MARSAHEFPVPAVKFLSLAVTGAQVVVTSMSNADQVASFRPFKLPRIPLTIVHWASAVGIVFRRERSACLALTLMLDCEREEWVWPAVPRQRCGRRRTRWSPREVQGSDRPGVWVGGTFQSFAGAGGIFDVSEQAPSFDGVHLVDQYDRKALKASYIYVRHGGKLTVADPAAFMVDDVRATLERHSALLRTF